MDCAISLTTLWNGNFLISVSVLDWYFLISHNAFSPLLTHLLFPSFLPSLPFSFSSHSLLFFLLIFFSIFSLALLALAHFIFSHAALISVTLVLHAISNNNNKFYLLHSSIYTPILILFLLNDSLANISGTYKPMHVIENKTKQLVKYLFLNQVIGYSLKSP